MTIVLTLTLGTFRTVETKWLLPRAGERINKGKAVSQYYCACSTLPQFGVDSINTLTNRSTNVVTSNADYNAYNAINSSTYH